MGTTKKKLFFPGKAFAFSINITLPTLDPDPPFLLNDPRRPFLEDLSYDLTPDAITEDPPLKPNG
ncbi:predicted protein [Arabidopsis lyrata subsp. lyrata]|uniref:Predicted protein n=1 Tax=Arabidopsis lyrata subsp. lyrata TaxID=81972 RepID=D7LE51_ARALL|nr:predicted protein [Arabidopsis lyrata subsp. lyrata]